MSPSKFDLKKIMQSLRAFSANGTAAVGGQLGLFAHAEGTTIATAQRHPEGLPSVKLWSTLATNGTALAEEFKRLGLGSLRCNTVLDADQYQLLIADAPAVPPAELRAAMRWRIKDMVSHPIEDTTVDVFPMPDGRRTSKNESVFIAAARNAAVSMPVTLVRSAGSRVQSVDVSDLAIRNVLALGDTDAEGLAFLYFAADYSVVSLYRQGQLYMSRRVLVGLTDVRQAMAGELSAQDDLLARITPELRRSLDYYESYYAMPALTQLRVWPSGELMTAFASSLGQTVDLQGAALDLPSLVNIETEWSPDMPGLLLALGAALRTEIAT